MTYLKNTLKSSTLTVPLNPMLGLSRTIIQKHNGANKPIRDRGAKSFLLDENKSTIIIMLANKAMLISGAIKIMSA
jgi:hypothetical protein